jgi:hypothetical protein
VDTSTPNGRLVFGIFASIADDAEGAVMQSHSDEAVLWLACQ